MDYPESYLGPEYDYHPADMDKQTSALSMTESSETGNSRLETLPHDLSIAIIYKLPPYYEDESDEWEEYAYRQDLKSLCLVSKRMDVIARACLFRKVIIDSARVLIKLYRTLLGAEHLANNIKEISFRVDFLYGLRPLSAAGRSQLLKDMNQHGTQPLRKIGGDEDDSKVICLLLYDILARASNLHSLQIFIMETSNSSDRVSDVAWNDDEPEAYHTLFNLVGTATRADARKEPWEAPEFLPRLEKISLRAEWSGGVRTQTFGCFLAIRSLRTIEGYNDDGHWAGIYENLPHRHGLQQPLQNITTLALSSSAACLHDMEDIAWLFPCLQDLSITVRHSRPGRIDDYLSRDSRRDVLTALEKMSRLQKLELNIQPVLDITSYLSSAYTASFGPQHKLSLAQLRSLEEIEVPLYMFAHIGLPARGQGASDPRVALPQSLKRMVLLADFYRCSDQNGIEARRCSMILALEFLELLRDDLGHFPQLESVAYLYAYDSCDHPFSTAVICIDGYDEEDMLNLSRLKGIQEAFAEHNVQFIVQVQSKSKMRGTFDLANWVEEDQDDDEMYS